MKTMRRYPNLITLILLTSSVVMVYFYHDIKLFARNVFLDSSTMPSEEKCSVTKGFYNSSWFRQRFNKSQNPFWTEDNLKLTPEIRKWWRNIQWSKASSEEQIMEKIFTQGVPRDYKYPTKSKGRRLKCAVVGNSYNLINSNYGEMIDSNDIVIRFNRAPTSPYETDVGTKTTYKLQYPQSAANLPKNSSLTFVAFKYADLQWFLKELSILPASRRISRNRTKIAVMHPAFMKYMHEKWLDNKGRYPSTGILGVGMALQLCDEIDIFGFGADKNGRWQHYWEHVPLTFVGIFRKTGVHNGDAEKKFLEKLQCEGIARVHRGE